MRCPVRRQHRTPAPPAGDAEATQSLPGNRNRISANNATLSGSATPARMPTNPPDRLTRIASVTRRISCDAPPQPNPISRVRSVTVTSMMFMIPMPEISSVIAETSTSTSDRINEIFFAALRIAVSMSTRYRAPGRCRASRISCSRVATRSTSCGERTCTYSGSIRSTGVK